ncbi:undecaprenyl-diphosphate phosphatase [Treponema pectinovorum]|uniref:undecaprenyl-diphosphate phosphatase n=1 Tax=Treponema pectinovorum TaxID=164 RepID=UPI0011C9D8D8|nr:undecaprenyl-diphosphate phosphatase [Treponema pectinovorum]
MSILQSIFLGILQGIAEFLPISSSGHLKLAQTFFNLQDVPLLYDVILHLATLLAVILYFRVKIAKLFVCLFRWILKRNENRITDETDLLSGSDYLGRKSIVAIICTTFVTGIIGIFTSKLIPDMPISYSCIGFLITALLLIFSGIKQKKSSSNEISKNGISIPQSLFIGLMQGIGTLPGISRSGSTIAGAQFAGVDRATAGEFSFIVSIPAILGAFVLEAKDLGQVGSSIGILPVAAGFVSAFVFGYFSLSVLMKLIKRGKLEWFAAYLIPLGILGLIFF